MHLSTIATIGLLGLAVLTPEPADAQRAPDRGPDRGQDFRAQGSSPYWKLEMDGRTMRFEPTGPQSVVVPQPRPIVGFAGEIYRTSRMTVSVNHIECSVLGRTWHDTVTVEAFGRTYRGCGGKLLDSHPPRPGPGPAITALSGEWKLVEVDGRRAWSPNPGTIRFDNGRASGNSGCNNFSAGYKSERLSPRAEMGKINFGPIASTKRMCGQRAANTQEFAVLDRLGKPLTYRVDINGRLLLTAPGGKSLTYARERPRPDRY